MVRDKHVAITKLFISVTKELQHAG